MPDNTSRLVYSTSQPVQRKEKPAQPLPAAGLPPEKQRVIVRLDRKSRGGKSVTLIEGLQLPQQERDTLLRKLKTRFGTGGTINASGGLEIQGDRCTPVLLFLEDMGYRPKRSGG